MEADAIEWSPGRWMSGGEWLRDATIDMWYLESKHSAKLRESNRGWSRKKG